MSVFNFEGYYYLPTSVGTWKLPYFTCNENAPSNITSATGVIIRYPQFSNLPNNVEGSLINFVNHDNDGQTYYYSVGDFTITNKSNKILNFTDAGSVSTDYFRLEYKTYYKNTILSSSLFSGGIAGSWQTIMWQLYFIIKFKNYIAMGYFPFQATQSYIPSVTFVEPFINKMGYVITSFDRLWPDKKTATAGFIRIITGSSGTEDIFDNGSFTPPPDGDPEPYQPGGETEPDVESPGGEWELPEYIPPDTPSPINDLNLGLFRAYAMTDSQLNQFSRQLWSKNILQQLRNLVVSPLDVVIQLLSLPFEPDASTNESTITFNWLDEWAPGESAATGYRLTTEYKEISFIGRSDINRYSGLFYDYLPYTRCHLYIPYIGYVEVKPNEFIKNHTLTIKYNVNQLTGEFTAFVKTSAMPYQLGQYQGQMGRALPLSMANYIPLISSTIQAAAYGTAAIGAASVAFESLPSSRHESKNMFGFDETKGQSKSFPVPVPPAMFDAVQVQRSSSLGPVTGRTSTQVPFLVFTIPHQNISSQQKILGYSSNLSGPLVNYNGVTKVRDIQLNIPSATLTEINELKSILEGGIEI